MTLEMTDGRLVLKDVNADVGTFSVLTVNAKGLVLSARALASADVVAALDYTPYNVTNPENFVSSTAFTSVIGPNGYTMLPGGLIFQWGTTTFTGVPSTSIAVTALDTPTFTSFVGVAAAPVTFPVPFPHAVFSCTGTGANNAEYIEGTEMSVGIMTLSNTAVQFGVGRVYGSDSAAGTTNAETGNIMWMAIGN